MAFFTTNYSNVNNNQGNYEPLPAGKYEMLILSASEEVAKTGSQSLTFKLVVRNDLDQALPATNGKYHNRVVWARVWKNKQTGTYNMDNLQYIMKAIGVPEGTPIESLEDFIKITWGKPVKVNVHLEDDDYHKGEKRNNVNPWDWENTEFIKVAHTNKDGQVMNQGQPQQQQTPDINASSLPF